jgi:hypothetical protein
MKHIYKAIAICLVLMPLSIAAYAAAEHDMSNMGQHEGMQHEGMGGMHGEMMPDMMSPEHLKKMQAHMLILHDLSNKILAEKDPKKQQVLKDQQLEVMKAHMADKMSHHKMDMSHPAPPPPATPKK